MTSHLRDVGDRSRDEVRKFRTSDILGQYFCFTYGYFVCGNFENFRSVAGSGGLGCYVERWLSPVLLVGAELPPCL